MQPWVYPQLRTGVIPASGSCIDIAENLPACFCLHNQCAGYIRVCEARHFRRSEHQIQSIRMQQLGFLAGGGDDRAAIVNELCAACSWERHYRIENAGGSSTTPLPPTDLSTEQWSKPILRHPPVA